MNELCKTKNDGELVLEEYRKNYNNDLIEELRSAASSDDTITEYLQPFIQFQIVEANYPHQRLTMSSIA